MYLLCNDIAMSETMSETMSDRIQASRTRRLLTQRELAARAGISRVHLARLETGGFGTRRPRRETVHALAAALEVDPEWLAFGSKMPPQTP